MSLWMLVLLGVPPWVAVPLLGVEAALLVEQMTRPIPPPKGAP